MLFHVVYVLLRSLNAISIFVSVCTKVYDACMLVPKVLLMPTEALDTGCELLTALETDRVQYVVCCSFVSLVRQTL